MAYLVFPGKRLNLNRLSIFVCFVLIFCCQVSCVRVNVTRKQRDIFSYSDIPGVQTCSSFCTAKKSSFYPSKSGNCVCECSFDDKTFVSANSKCMKDQDIRNASEPLEFVLYSGETRIKYLEVLSFESDKTHIRFDVPNKYKGKCYLNDIQKLSQQKYEWISVKRLIKPNIFELDDDHIETTHQWIPMQYEGWMLLTLNWSVSPTRFHGNIMRINVTCKKNKKSATGLMVFKVNGTLKYNLSTSSTLTSSPSSTYYLTPTPSITQSTTSVYTSLLMVSTTMTSLRPLNSSSFKTVMSSSFKTMMSSSFKTVMSSSFKTVMSSSFQPTTSSMISSSRSTSEAGTKQSTFSLTVASMVLSSSSVMVGPAMSSKTSSNAALTGGIVAGIVVLLLMIVLLVYFLRKRRIKVLRRKHSDLSHINPSLSSLTNLPAMSNPLNDGVGVYENPEVVDGTNRRSGVTSVESPAYDAFLAVENPSARDTKSVYDNIPEPAESTYKSLDPAKREASAKYQSLIKPNDHEYSTLMDTVSGAPIQEPLYSEVGNGPSPVPVKNGGPKSPSPPPLTPRKPRTSVVAEPIYNELESSGSHASGNNPTASSRPQQELPNATVAEPIYNELENSGSQAEGGVKPKEDANPTPSRQGPDSPTPAEPIYNELEGSGYQITEDERPNELANGLEESNESDGRNGPVYSVLEDEQI